jgi:hypothetical protein
METGSRCTSAKSSTKVPFSQRHADHDPVNSPNRAAIDQPPDTHKSKVSADWTILLSGWDWPSEGLRGPYHASLSRTQQKDVAPVAGKEGLSASMLFTTIATASGWKNVRNHMVLECSKPLTALCSTTPAKYFDRHPHDDILGPLVESS